MWSRPGGRRLALPALALLLAACRAPLPEGELVEEDWVRPTSELEARLEVPCVGAEGGDGAWRVLVDDASGFTVLVEEGTGRAWLRDGFGVISDRCWWVPTAAEVSDLPDSACVTEGQQLGTCDGSEQLGEEWRFVTPGLAEAQRPLGAAAAADGLLVAWIGDLLHRLDLDPADRPSAGALDGPRSFRGWLTSMPAPSTTLSSGPLAVADDALVAWDAADGRLWTFPREALRSGLQDGRDRGAPKGPGALHAAGGFAAVAVEGVAHVFDRLDARPRRERRRRPELVAPLDVVVDPADGDVWVLVEDGVIGLPTDGAPSFHPTPGAEALLLGRPGDVPTPYAWGNDGGAGVLYRLEPDGPTRAHRLDERLLGAGIGTDFQEIVLVVDTDDGVRVRGVLDEGHLEALPEGAVALALAVFAERPHDADLLLGGSDATSAIAACEAEEEAHGEAGVVCCVHRQRAEAFEAAVAWLEHRLDDAGPTAAVVLGVNPTVLAVSTWCDAQGEEALSEDGARLPEAVGETLLDWQDRGVGSAAVLLHSAPYTPEAWWVSCPDGTPRDAPDSCWDVPVDEESYRSFYEEAVAAAALAPWVGEEPDWRLLGGGYPGSDVSGTPGWTGVLPDLPLPDGEPADDGLYFGLLGMDPAIPSVAEKDLAPKDARQRAFPVPVGHPAGSWDDGSGSTGVDYHPGQTFAASWLYELRRSGLLFHDFSTLPHPSTDWSDPDIEGAEGTGTINRADLVLQEHYLVTRVLAHRDVRGGRFWTMHLMDLSLLRTRGLDEGLVDCVTDCTTDTELDRFLDRVEGLGPAVRWSPVP